MKKIAKRLAAAASTNFYQRLMVYAILREDFSQLDSVPLYKTREMIWEAALTHGGGVNLGTMFVEYGVHRGYSIEYFSKLSTNPHSRFIGLDSFSGLPETWAGLPKGTFDVRGAEPELIDPRIMFVKGWFQDTAEQLFNAVNQYNLPKLIVHYDADLFSSTLFALSQIDRFKRRYIAIFDEFTGHETRALFDYLQAFNATVTFLGKTASADGYPAQVMCEISPRLC